MRASLVTALLASVVLAASSCGSEVAPFGGEPEQQLVAATTTVDLGRVTQLLASGADPNKMVRVEGSYQSSWFLALAQVRPHRPDMVEMIRVMLKAGASTKSAWGTGPEQVKISEPWWRTFARTTRVAGAGPDNPVHVAMFHPVPEVVRALVQAGLDPRQGQAALVSAIETGEIEIVHVLVDAGVDVNCHPGANTPLVAAIETRNVALMTYLEEHGAREKP